MIVKEKVYIGEIAYMAEIDTDGKYATIKKIEPIGDETGEIKS